MGEAAHVCVCLGLGWGGIILLPGNKPQIDKGRAI